MIVVTLRSPDHSRWEIQLSDHLQILGQRFDGEGYRSAIVVRDGHQRSFIPPRSQSALSIFHYNSRSGLLDAELLKRRRRSIVPMMFGETGSAICQLACHCGDVFALQADVIEHAVIE
jgi:hypothetical protein